jgi:hypothetical protein
MPSRAQFYVGAMAIVLAAALACDDGGPAGTQGPPPPVGGGPDTTAPQTVSDLALSYRPATRDVEFAWTAPRDDDDTDHVARYDIRYSYAFPLDWDLSVPVANPPSPQPEGTPQTYALPAPSRGRELYAAARTYDAAGNPSPLGPVAHLRVPGVRFEAVCQDVWAGSPAEGLDALLTTNAPWNLTTGPDGRLVLDDITSGTIGIRLETGAAASTYHRYENSLVAEDDTLLSVAMIQVLPVDSPDYRSTLDLLIDALVTSGQGQILKRWHTYPIPWHASEYVNGNSLDYTALTRQAAAQWNARTGLEIFVEVPAPPEHGIEFLYLPRSSMGIQNGLTEHKNDAEGYPSGETIKIVDDFSDGAKLYSILMHELGHTIRLGHLPAGFVMFGGQPLPLDITDDEVRVVQMMLVIPNGTNLSLYDASATLP